MSGFSGLISQRDRARLREITRRVHLKHYPKEHLDDLECDRFIDAMSEKVIEANLRAGVDTGLVR